ncbi:MAG: hypothetical protein K8S87_00105 [Planctomycetes bacterium]|nr:hypothetical protein [Planctomycetota bacterium]
MKQSIINILFKFGSKRGFITAIVSALGVMISGIWFGFIVMFQPAEAIPIVIFICFVLGGILLELIVFRLISNKSVEDKPIVNDSDNSETQDAEENQQENNPSNADDNSDANAETSAETSADLEK